MARSPGSARALDLQALKQALASTTRAIKLFVEGDDEDALAQAELAERFLGEFVESRQPSRRRKGRT